jgi:uncharacterized membrane protein YgcG
MQVGEWDLLISEHLFDRTIERNNSEFERTYAAVKKVPSVGGYLDKMSVNEDVWVYDKENNVSIVLKKKTGKAVTVGSMVQGPIRNPEGNKANIVFPNTVPTYIVRKGKLGGFMDMGRAWGKIPPDAPLLKNPVIPPTSPRGGGSGGGGSFTGRMGGGGGSGGSSRIDTIHDLNPGKLPIYETD